MTTLNCSQITMVKSSSCRSRAENVLIFNALFNALFSKPQETKGFRPNTETQKSHRQGRAIVRPCFRCPHKVFDML